MEDNAGTVKSVGCAASIFGEALRDGAAEFGMLKGQGSPCTRCPADKPRVGGEPRPAVGAIFSLGKFGRSHQTYA